MWNFEYNFKKAYNMTSLLPADFDNLLSRMLADSSIAQEYLNYFYKSTSFHSCDSACAENIVKGIKMTLSVPDTSAGVDDGIMNGDTDGKKTGDHQENMEMLR